MIRSTKFRPFRHNNRSHLRTTFFRRQLNRRLTKGRTILNTRIRTIRPRITRLSLINSMSSLHLITSPHLRGFILSIRHMLRHNPLANAHSITRPSRRYLQYTPLRFTSSILRNLKNLSNILNNTSQPQVTLQTRSKHHFRNRLQSNYISRRIMIRVHNLSLAQKTNMSRHRVKVQIIKTTLAIRFHNRYLVRLSTLTHMSKNGQRNRSLLIRLPSTRPSIKQGPIPFKIQKCSRSIILLTRRPTRVRHHHITNSTNTRSSYSYRSSASRLLSNRQR